MKKLLLIFSLLFTTMMFSTPAHAEWDPVGETQAGSFFYVDYGRIREHEGYFYFWMLTDYLVPKGEVFSAALYKKADCKMFRFKPLSYNFYPQQMAGGTADSYTPKAEEDWVYPRPDSMNEKLLKRVCS